jgi:hypothetical protein
MKATIKACLKGIGNHDADLSLFKDRKWLTQKLNGLDSALEHLSNSEEEISVFKANVKNFLGKTESESSNAEIRTAIRDLIKNIDLLTGHKPIEMP